MDTGYIKRVKADKGFGFIGRTGEADVFFHCKDLRGLTFSESLTDVEVSFDLQSTDKGLRAVNVRAVE